MRINEDKMVDEGKMNDALDDFIRDGLHEKAERVAPSREFKQRVSAAVAAAADGRPSPAVGSADAARGAAVEMQGTRLLAADERAASGSSGMAHGAGGGTGDGSLLQPTRHPGRGTGNRPLSRAGRKRWRLRDRVAAVVAACCLVGIGTAVAVGTVASVSSHSYHSDMVTAYEQVAGLEEDAGFDANIPEAFGNGYVFKGAVPVEQQGLDADGNVLSENTGISVEYGKAGAVDVELFVEPRDSQLDDSSGIRANSQREFAGVMVSYSHDEYLICPDGYQLSDEQLERQRNDEHFVVSYGDPREAPYTTFYDSAVFAVGDVTYILSAFDAGSGTIEDDLFEMARQVIGG
ncbi:MAG: hypothetical protein Q4A93_06635 [Actinomycetota bacterium]|nr:hypothetical protein [Actinomycetota bacterium]